MITVKYPDGRIETRSYAIISGDPPIGSARPIPDEATMIIMDGCIKVSKGTADEGLIWPMSKITEISLGPKMSETTVLRE
jgi:hypothetical protein